MKTMRTFFILFLLSGLSFSSSAQCAPKKVSKTYMSICPNDVKSEKKKVNLTTKAIPKKIDGKTEIHVVHYYVLDKSKHSTDQEFLDYANSLKELEMHVLSINGREFTGVLKVATSFVNGGDNHDQSGYNVIRLEYLDGKLVKTDRFEDVDLEKGTQINR